MTQHILTISNYLQNPIKEAIRLLKDLHNSWAEARFVNQTVKELSALTDKELKDIGLSRGDIYSVARGDITHKRSVNYKVETNPNLEGSV